MNIILYSFILLLASTLSCQQASKSAVQKQDRSIAKIDTVLFLASEDSCFLRITNKDTTGFAIDFLNRFSEESGVPYRLVVCENQSAVYQKFLAGEGNLFLDPSMHDSLIMSDNLLTSYAIVSRTLKANSTALADVMFGTYPVLQTMPKTQWERMKSSLTAIKETHLLVQSKFRLLASDSLFLNQLNAYIRNVEFRADVAFLKNYYFGVSLPINMKKYLIPAFRNGALSPYDNLFKTAAEKYDWDWKLLAAVAFKESRFDPTAIGGGGAFGLMQFMPSIGRKYGVSIQSTPQEQINAGMKSLHNTFMSWSQIPSKEQRIKFTLASYNAGKAHIDDAQRLAEKYGLNPLVWDGNVQLMVNNLSMAKYHTDEVVRFGAYHGHAHRYANLVYQIYLSWSVR
jgi:membrane-bound lytic murein transglycosylase MltF